MDLDLNLDIDYEAFYEEALGTRIRWRGKEGTTNCPFHDDRDPSFSVNREKGVYYCHACGEKGNAITMAQRMGIDLAEFDNSGNLSKIRQKRSGEKFQDHDREHVYNDEFGNPLHLVGIDGTGNRKSVIQYHRVNGKWRIGKPKRVVPYRLPELIRAVQAGDPVYVVEGEKDADTMHRQGFTATTNPGGAGKWPESDDFNRYFQRAKVIILPDNDEAGRKHAEKVAEILRKWTDDIRIVHLPGLPEKEDVTYWFEKGGTAQELKAIVERSFVQSSPKATNQYVDPEKFFANGKFQPVVLGRVILEQLPAIAHGTEIYTYENGVYQAGGEARLRKKALDLLGDRYLPIYVHQAVEWIRTKLLGEPVQEFNVEDGFINVENGLVNWRTGELLPHTPERYSSIRIPVTYDPSADCPDIEKFFSEIVPPDAVPTLYELFGYCLIPTNRYQKAFLLHGTGANGKSTLLKLLERFVGPQNVSNVPLHRLEKDKFKVALLKDKLVNIFADISHKGLDTSSTFKALTGEDRINAEFKGKDGFDFRPFARLIFSANVPPTSSDVSNGFFRRWIVIPFPNSFEGRQDPRLLERLTTPGNLSGLLNRALHGLRRLEQKNGFTMGPSLQEAHKKYQQEADNISGFLAECCEIGPSLTYPRKELFLRYTEWCQENGMKPTTKKKFNQRLLEEISGLRIVRKYMGPELWNGITFSPKE